MCYRSESEANPNGARSNPYRIQERAGLNRSDVVPLPLEGCPLLTRMSNRLVSSV